MKISTKGRYGLRALLDLAVYGVVEQVPVRNIAARQNISENYLEQVFSALKKAGLVKSVKGAQGGYTLVENPSQIRVGTVLRILEGDLSVMDDLEDVGGSREIRKIRATIKRNIWDPMDIGISEVVDGITIADLAGEYQTLLGKKAYMFYI